MADALSKIPTKEVLMAILERYQFSFTEAAKHFQTSRTSVRRWCKKFDINVLKIKKPEIMQIAKTKFSIYDNRKVPKNEKPETVLIGADWQAPFQHPRTLEFLLHVWKRFNCTRFVCIGDEMESYMLSSYTKSPEAMSATEEYEKAMKFMKTVYKTFPNADVCISNHTSRPYRLAREAGIPSLYLKKYNEWMQAPSGWVWHDRFEINGVMYQHGTGYSGPTGHVKAAIDNQQSTVIGHLHSKGGVQYIASHNDLIFGMNVGCLLDLKTYAFEYGKQFGKKPTIGCGVVIGGKEAYFIPMNLGSRVIRVRKDSK